MIAVDLVSLDADFGKAQCHSGVYFRHRGVTLLRSSLTQPFRARSWKLTRLARWLVMQLLVFKMFSLTDGRVTHLAWRSTLSCAWLTYCCSFIGLIVWCLTNRTMITLFWHSWGFNSTSFCHCRSFSLHRGTYDRGRYTPNSWKGLSFKTRYIHTRFTLSFPILLQFHVLICSLVIITSYLSYPSLCFL